LDALGRRKPERVGIGGESDGALVEPILQHGQPADAGEIFAGGVVLEQAAFADDLLFLGEDFVDVIGTEALVFDDDLGENILRFAEGKSERGLQQPLAPLAVQLDFHLFEFAHVLDDFIEQGGKVVFGRLREIDDGDLLVELGRDLHHRRNQDDGLETVLEMEGDVLEPPDNCEVIAGQERVEVLEQKDGRLDLLDDEVQGGERVFGGRVAALLGLDGSAGRDDAAAIGPFEHFFLPFGGNLDQDVLDPHFLAGNEVKDRVTGADQGLDFRGEVHGNTTDRKLGAWFGHPSNCRRRPEESLIPAETT
jgi:hypothetical protein